MEAPDKIYMTPSYGEPDNVLLASFSKSHLDYHRDIEYIRKDALLEFLRKEYALVDFHLKAQDDPVWWGQRNAFQQVIDKLNSM